MSSSTNLCLSAALLAALASSGAACSRAGAGTLPGRELFAACTSCHGTDGLGNHRFGAPSIAGLPAWYVEAQLVKFRSGARGAHPDDAEGLRMGPMARQMMNDGEVKEIASYVASLPRPPIGPSLQGGDPGAGAVSFAACVPCHGAGGQGNEQLKAPPIAGQADWYLLAQIKKFRAGIRGGDTADLTGATMRPMAMTLPNEQAVLNVVSHVATLGRREGP